MKRIRDLIARVGGEDFLVGGGLILTGVGLAFVYWPAALIVPGAVLFALGVWLASSGQPPEEGE